MGGEHFIGFHNRNSKNMQPCCFIDCSDEQFIVTKHEENIWKKLKIKLLQFMSSFACSYPDIKHLFDFRNLNEQIDSIKTIDDLLIAAHWRDHEKILNIFHDIHRLLILCFPERICAYFDRCNFTHMYNNNNSWYDFTIRHDESLIERHPKFFYYQFDFEEFKKIVAEEHDFNYQYCIEKGILPIQFKLLNEIFPRDILTL